LLIAFLTARGDIDKLARFGIVQIQNRAFANGIGFIDRLCMRRALAPAQC